MNRSVGAPRLVLVLGDITVQSVDAIVNAANEALSGGGGVDGAIHRVAGPELLRACMRLPEVRPGVRCPTGAARLTPAFGLPARYVIHAVGPRYRGLPEDAERLASAYRSALSLAVSKRVRSVAFPAISCGVYGYPHHEAARIALGVFAERCWPLQEVRFVLFGASLHEIFRSEAEGLGIVPSLRGEMTFP